MESNLISKTKKRMSTLHWPEPARCLTSIQSQGRAMQEEETQGVWCCKKEPSILDSLLLHCMSPEGRQLTTAGAPCHQPEKWPKQPSLFCHCAQLVTLLHKNGVGLATLVCKKKTIQTSHKCLGQPRRQAAPPLARWSWAASPTCLPIQKIASLLLPKADTGPQRKGGVVKRCLALHGLGAGGGRA